MRTEDLNAIKNLLDRNGNTLSGLTRALVSCPHPSEVFFLQEVFQTVEVTDIPHWDFYNPSPDGQSWDLIQVANAFLYSKKPDVWFKNILQSCRFLLIQDAISGRRGSTNDYFGDDGDSTRFSFSAFPSPCHITFDMSPYEERIVDMETFSLGKDGWGNEVTHFVALMKGDIG